METLTELETLVTSIKVDAEKFFDKKNKSAGIRARKSAQELKINGTLGIYMVFYIFHTGYST